MTDNAMHGKKLLLIEDSLDVQTFVRAIARLEGAELAVASTGEEGLDLLVQDGPPDLVILDLNLPGIQGWDILEALRVVDAPHPPVLIFSAVTDPVTQERAAALGVAGFLAKPVGAREFVEAVAKSLA